MGIFSQDSLALTRPSSETFNMPFQLWVIFEGTVPGKTEERLVEGGKMEDGIVFLHQVGKSDLVIPWEKVQAILPILPPGNSDVSVENLRSAMRVLQAHQPDWPTRTEVSKATLEKWQERIDGILRLEEGERRKKQEEEDAKIRQAARERAEAELAAKETEKARLVDLARRKVANYQGFRTRKEIEEAVQSCDKLDKSDLAKITDYEKVAEYWKRCLALPADVAMPGVLESQNGPSIALLIDPSATGPALTVLAWVLFLVPLVLALNGLSRLMALLQERAWLGLGLWAGISVAAGTCLFLLFFYDRINKVDEGGGDDLGAQMPWVALTNAKEKNVTRFAEKIEIPPKSFLQQIVGNIKRTDSGSTDWVPMLTYLPTVGSDSVIKLGLEVPLKWISLPVRISFAFPLSDQEISLKAIGGKIGPFSVGASGGAWIWEQIAPAYQGIATELGLDQGVRLILLNSDKLVVSIPEVRAKLKPSP